MAASLGIYERHCFCNSDLNTESPILINALFNLDFDSVDSYMSDKCKGKQWKMILKEWLNLLRAMRNARSLSQSKIIQEILIERFANFVMLLI